MQARFKTAWCVRCNREQPYRRTVLKGIDDKGWISNMRGLKGWQCCVCFDPVVLPSKYKSEPTRSKHTGRMFHSKKESRREPALLALANVGVIKDLQYQVPYSLNVYGTQAVDELIQAILRLSNVAEPLADFVTAVARSKTYVGRYISDFSYLDDNGDLVVEDVKGYRTAVYRLKKRLMQVCQNIEIQEPGSGGIQQRARGAGVRGVGTGSRLMGGR